MAKTTSTQKTTFKKGSKVIFNGKKYKICIVVPRETGTYYALEGRLGLVNEQELTQA